MLKDFFLKFRQHVRWVLMPAQEKQRRLDAVLATLRLVPETSALLDLAEQTGARICFDARLIWGASYGQYRAKDNNILLRPELSDDNALDQVLAHELFHLWQHHTVGIAHKKSVRLDLASPLVSLQFERVVEASAFTFQIFYAHRLKAFQSFSDPALIDAAAPDKNILFHFFQICLQIVSNGYDQDSARRICLNNKWLDRSRFDADGTAPDPAADMRRMAQAGGLAYLEDLSDAQLRAVILRRVDPRLRKTMRLVDAFANAAARKDTAETKRLGTDITARMKQPTLKKKA